MNRTMYRGASDAVDWLRGGLLPIIGALVAIGLAANASAADLKESGTVHIEQYQVAFIGSGNLGGGTLKFQGKTYKFTIGGVGIGGFGASKITANGTVYNLTKLSDFAGAYGQARTGFAAAVGDVRTGVDTLDKGGGTLWLENTKGVYMKLASTREGLALALGGDAVYIDLD